MEFKDTGKRIRIIIVFVIILLVPFVMYMRKEHRLAKSRELYVSSKGYELAGSYKKAIEVLAEAMELNPDNPEIKTKIGELYIRTGREEEGVDMLKGVSAEHPAYPDPYYHLAFYYYNRGDYRVSRTYWEAFLKRNKNPLYDDIAKRRISEIDGFQGNLTEENSEFKED